MMIVETPWSLNKDLALETNGSMGSDLISTCIRLSRTRKLVALVSSSMRRVVAPISIAS